jgi:hypothetical protein
LDEENQEMTKPVDCCTDEIVAGQTHNQTIMARARSWVLTPRGLTVAGIGVVAIGLALNWSWLVAVGAAPLVLSFAPCAAMCALGLCMNMRGHPKTPADTRRDGAPPGQSATLVDPETAPKT